MFGVPPNTLPLVINIHRDILLSGIIKLQHVFKQLPVGLMMLSDGMVHFLKIEKNYLQIYQNYFVALTPFRFNLNWQ